VERDQRTRQLFTLQDMGDRKPSQFLRHLKSLVPDIPDNYLRIPWTSRLPTNIRTILAGMPEVELDAAGLSADRIMETVSPSTVASTGPGPDYTELLQSIRDLTRQLASELYRPSDRSSSANLVPAFAGRGFRMVSATDPYCRILGFLDRDLK
jgi:hypothetical protein